MQTFCKQLSDDGSVTLTAYLHDLSPEMPNLNTRPCIMILPGGGYNMLSDREGEPVAAAFFAHGYNAFVLRYSVGKNKRFSDAFRDGQNALRLIRANASEWHINPRQIAVCGFSAGGHLAASLGVNGQERPNAMILAYPCILDSMSRILAFPVPSCDEAVDSNTPQAFLFHTSNDQCVPVENSLRMADALAKNNIRFEMHIFSDGPHGLSLANRLTGGGSENMINPSAEQWLPLCLNWLDNVLNTDSD